MSAREIAKVASSFAAGTITERLAYQKLEDLGLDSDMAKIALSGVVGGIAAGVVNSIADDVIDEVFDLFD